MSDLYKHMLNLSEGQKKKLKFAFKKRGHVTIGLASDQLRAGKDGILLTGEQSRAVKRALKNSKGLRLIIGYDQLVKSKEGGLLNEVLEFIEDNIPFAKRITPLIRNKAAPAIKEYVVPWLKEWLNSELDKIINGKVGSGLCKKTLGVVRTNLNKAAQKKLSQLNR